MIKKVRKLNIWIKDIVTWFIFWTVIVLPTIEFIFKKAFPDMINNYFYFFSFLITGILIIPAVFSVHAYYTQKKEIESIKSTISYSAANIYRNFAAFSNNSPYCVFLYSYLALEKYIEMQDQENTGQLLNEMVLIIKKIEYNKLTVEDISRLNTTLNKLDQNRFDVEIQQIHETVKTIT